MPSSLALLGRGVVARCAAPLEVARLVPATVGRVGTTLWNLGTRRDNGHGSVRPFTAPRTSFNATLTARRSTAFTDVPLADFKKV